MLLLQTWQLWKIDCLLDLYFAIRRKQTSLSTGAIIDFKQMFMRRIMTVVSGTLHIVSRITSWQLVFGLLFNFFAFYKDCSNWFLNFGCFFLIVRVGYDIWICISVCSLCINLKCFILLFLTMLKCIFSFNFWYFLFLYRN